MILTIILLQYRNKILSLYAAQFRERYINRGLGKVQSGLTCLRFASYGNVGLRVGAIVQNRWIKARHSRNGLLL